MSYPVPPTSAELIDLQVPGSLLGPATMTTTSSATFSLSVLLADLHSSNPQLENARCFAVCELNGNSESTEISDGRSLLPAWTHFFEVPVSPPANSKLYITIYEHQPWNQSIPLGRAEIHTINFRHYLGTTKTFPLEPIAKPHNAPPGSLARHIVIQQCTVTLQFSSIDPTSSSLPPIVTTTPVVEKVETTPSPISSASSPPPLPPRTHLPNLSEPSLPSQTSAVVSSQSQGPLDAAKSISAISPPISSPSSPGPHGSVSSDSSFSSSAPAYPPGALLVSANETPAPVSKKEPGLFSRFANYISGGSSAKDAHDAWFSTMLQSDKNKAAEFENTYVDYEMQGHKIRLESLPVDLRSYVYLYVPGLYSGNSPFAKGKQSNTGEPKITRHAKRVEELKSLGFDARLVVVPNDGTVYSNAHLIRVAMEEAFEQTKKPLVLIGYSKGGVDSAAALSISPGYLVAQVRCFITLFSPLKGSHIASDIEDSLLRPVVHMAIKNYMESDSAAMSDLSMEKRSHFLRLHPFVEGVPALSLATSVTPGLARSSPFGPPYNYIKSRYSKESDGLVAAQDAIYPGAHMILLHGMDHVGPRPEYPVFRNHISFIVGVIEVAINQTTKQWQEKLEKRLYMTEEEKKVEEEERRKMKEELKGPLLKQMHTALNEVKRQAVAEGDLPASAIEENPSNTSNNSNPLASSDIEANWVQYPSPDDDFFVAKPAEKPSSSSSDLPAGSPPPLPPHNPVLEKSVHTATVLIEPPALPPRPK